MSDYRSLDRIVRTRLSDWPQHPPGFVDHRPAGEENADEKRDGWLRGRPSHPIQRVTQPFLKLPGGAVLRTVPDGLWLRFGGSYHEAFVDIFAVEACSTLANFLDKRSRFAPSTHSMLAVCPEQWLLAEVAEDEPMPRWLASGVIASAPTHAIALPVRDMRVLYGLKRGDYQMFARTQVPHPHEFIVPVEALTAEDGHASPAMHALLARAAPNANILRMAEHPVGPRVIAPRRKRA